MDLRSQLFKEGKQKLAENPNWAMNGALSMGHPSLCHPANYVGMSTIPFHPDPSTFTTYRPINNAPPKVPIMRGTPITPQTQM